jgi:hypothetical protein
MLEPGASFEMVSYNKKGARAKRMQTAEWRRSAIDIVRRVARLWPNGGRISVGLVEGNSIVVEPAGSGAEWAAFLKGSPNATLFHDLDFLGYHPAGRFQFQHLVFRRRNRIVAVLPGGLADAGDAKTFISPLGASFGGPALATRLAPVEALEIVGALEEYAKANAWQGISLILPPEIYAPEIGGTIGWALQALRFSLASRWLCQIIPIESEAPDQYARLFRDTHATNVRTGRRQGIEILEGGVDLLDQFLPLLDDTYRRHGTAPTHSHDELRRLTTRMPERFITFLSVLDGRAISALFVMLLSSRVATTFYICNSESDVARNGNVVAMAGAIDYLAKRGCRYLDLGPSSDGDGRLNAGVAFFKHGLGAAGHCRDRWIWAAGSKPETSAPGTSSDTISGVTQ